MPILRTEPNECARHHAFSHAQKCEDHVKSIPSRSLTALAPEKWGLEDDSILSYWVSVIFHGRTVKLQGCASDSIELLKGQFEAKVPYTIATCFGDVTWNHKHFTQITPGPKTTCHLLSLYKSYRGNENPLEPYTFFLFGVSLHQIHWSKYMSHIFFQVALAPAKDLGVSLTIYLKHIPSRKEAVKRPYSCL